MKIESPLFLGRGLSYYKKNLFLKIEKKGVITLSNV
jgi:hypothetical protein